MSKKDYKQGMSDAMEAYEAFSEKQEAATRHVAKQVDKVAGKMDKLGGQIDSIADYITDQEKAALYKLNTPIDIADLEDAEKRILLAVLYQLTSDEDEVTEEQQNYVRAVQQYLKIYNPQTEIDLEAVENIEDISAQKAVLQAVLEFFYLGTHPGTYSDDQMDFLDCFQVNRKTRKEISGHIKAIVEAVGVKGLSEKYGFVAAQPHSEFAKYKDNGRIPEKVADLCIAQLREEKPEEDYDDLDEEYGTSRIFHFSNRQYFLETKDYMVFRKLRFDRFDTDDELITDNAVGFFRIDKHTGKIERLDINYKKDFGFFHSSDLSFCVYGNIIYFVESYPNTFSENAKKNAKIIKLDIAEKTCTVLPFALPSGRNYYHLSANASYLLIHILLTDGNHELTGTKTYVTDLTTNMRTFVLEPKLDKIWDAFLWDNRFMILGGIGCNRSIYEYNISQKTVTDLFEHYAGNEDFNYRLNEVLSDGTPRQFNRTQIVIEQMQCKGETYYFLMSGVDWSNNHFRVQYYKGINLEKLDTISSRAIFRGGWLDNNPVYIMDHCAIHERDGNLDWYDYSTEKTHYAIAKASHFVLLGDYLYKYHSSSEQWQKANISNGLDDLQWEIMSSEA